MSSSSPAPLASRRAVLFDLDGTLVDSVGDITSAVNDVLGDERLAPLADADVRRLVGDGAAVLVSRAFRAREAAEPADALARFRARYDARCLDTTRPYAGVPELLAALASRGTRVGVVTNKPTTFAEKVVKALGLARHVGAVVGPELAAAPKPSPAHVLAALERLGAAPSEAVVVGDGSTDVRAGRASGCATVGVLWGYRSREELLACGPDHVVATVGELAALLGVAASRR